MERRGRSPENLSNRQRAKREELRAQKRKKTRIWVAGAISGTVIAASAVAWGLSQAGSEDGPSIESTPTTSETNLPLRQLTSEHVTELAIQAVTDYTNITGVSVNQEKFLNNFTFVPNYNHMTAEEKQRFCGTEKAPLPCHEAAGYSGGFGEVFIYKDQIDAQFPFGTSDLELNRVKRDEAVYFVAAHEISHWLPVSSGYSDELYDLVLEFYGDKNPELRDRSHYQKGLINGALLMGQEVNGQGGFLAFRGVEEAEAEVIARYILTNRNKKVYANLENPKDTYFVPQRKMMEELLHKLSPDYSESVRLLAQLRVQEGGQEEFMRIIGRKFGSEETALRYGFETLYAIDSGNMPEFISLTMRR